MLLHAFLIVVLVVLFGMRYTIENFEMQEYIYIPPQSVLSGGSYPKMRKYSKSMYPFSMYPYAYPTSA